MTRHALSCRGVMKRFGRRTALDSFSLDIPPGAVMGLVGANGAGKTTWMMTVAGFLVPDAGEIDILGLGPFDAAVHSGLFSILPQDSELPSEATPESMLYRFARMQGMKREEAWKNVRQLLDAVNLLDRAKSKIRNLSHGMRKRVMAAQCFIGEPDLVLLDEPLNGLDPIEAARLRRFISSRKGRQTLVISSHNLHDIEALCTHVAFVENGRVVKTEALGEVSGGCGRVSYVVGTEPKGFDELRAAVPGAEISWSAADSAVVCSFDDGIFSVAEVNRRLLPLLLAATDVHKVTPGISLEEIFLNTQN